MREGARELGSAGWGVLTGTSASSLVVAGTLLAGVARGQNATNETLGFPDGTGFQGQFWLVALLLALSTAILVGVFAGLSWLHDRVMGRIRAIGTGPDREVRVGNFRIRSTAWLRSGFEHLADLSRAILLLLAVAIYVPFVLSLFEATAGIARRVLSATQRHLGAMQAALAGYVPNLVFIVLISVLAWIGLKLLKALFSEIHRGRITVRGFYPSWASPTYVLVRFVAIAFVLVLILPRLPGFGSSAFEGISVFVGALVALGASSAMANVVSGVVLTYTRAFSVGDRVKIADTLGDVVDRTLLVTRVRTIKNEDITIPNAQVLSNHIVNYTGLSEERPLIVASEVSIGYEVPWRDVNGSLIEAAQATDGVLAEPEPFVLQRELGDHAVTYEVNGYTDVPEAMTRLRSRLHENIRDVFDEAGIEILSPTHTTFHKPGREPGGEGPRAPSPRGDEGTQVVPDAGELTEREQEIADRAEAEADADAAAEDAWTEEEEEGNGGDGDERARDDEAEDAWDEKEPGDEG